MRANNIALKNDARRKQDKKDADDETRRLYAVRKNGVDASSSRSARTARGRVQVVHNRGLPQRDDEMRSIYAVF